MKLIVITLACIAVSLVAVACTETAAPTNNAAPASAASPAKPVDELAAVRANYQKHCEGCHAETGEGGKVKTPEGKEIKVPSLKSEHAKSRTDEHITKMITGGEEEMPAFKDKMSQAEIADMVKFIRKNFQGK